MRMGKREPLEFDQSVERGMFHPLDFSNVHQAPESLFIKNFSVWREHRSQLEGQDLRISAARRLVDRGFLFCRFPVKPARLKQNRDRPMTDNDVHLLPVQPYDVTRLIFD